MVKRADLAHASSASPRIKLQLENATHQPIRVSGQRSTKNTVQGYYTPFAIMGKRSKRLQTKVAGTSASLAATTSTTDTVSTAAQDGGAERSKNISWHGSANQHLAHLIRTNYASYLAPPQGQLKVGYPKAWAKELGILHLNPKGNKTKQNIDKLVSSWKTANTLSQRTGFGSIEVNGKTVTAKEQILGICEVYDILAPALEDRRTTNSTVGLSELGLFKTSDTQVHVAVDSESDQDIQDNVDDAEASSQMPASAKPTSAKPKVIIKTFAST
jgi:hypothetical protein